MKLRLPKLRRPKRKPMPWPELNGWHFDRPYMRRVERRIWLEMSEQMPEEEAGLALMRPPEPAAGAAGLSGVG